MANTSETLGGDSAVLERLISHTLSELTDDTVLKLGAYALQHNAGLTALDLPNADTVGKYSLSDCSSLDSASFQSLEVMPDRMFSGCKNLKSISLPSLKTTGFYGFQNCSNLTVVILPSSVTALNTGLFHGCAKLKEVNAANVASIGSYAFCGCKELISVSFPNITVIEESTFEGCSSLRSIALPAVTRVGQRAFMNVPIETLLLPSCIQLNGSNIFGLDGAHCIDFSQKLTINTSLGNNYNLTHLILRANEVCPLQNANAFSQTPINSGCGFIYVPYGLVETYRSAANWQNYADQIVAISEYPKAITGTITDSWETILANPNYAEDYAVGNTKILEMDGSKVLMQIAAFDTDILASGNGTAGITWISVGSLDRYKPSSSYGVTGGWAGTNSVRNYLRDTMFPKIDATVRAGIKEVTKTYRTKSPEDATLSIADTIWVPSAREVGFTDADYVEASGVDYPGIFIDNASRMRREGPYGERNTCTWWLRTTRSANNVATVSNNGVASQSAPNTANNIVFGFCTN